MEKEKLFEIFSEAIVVDKSKVSYDSSSDNLPEWDSLGHVNLLMAVENHFGISFDIADAIDIETISDLSDMTSKYLTAKGS